MACSVVCVLRGGGEFAPEHVRKLYEGVRRWWPAKPPLRFVVLTDTPIHVAGIEERLLSHQWVGWWSKMELFLGAQDDLGDILYFDLDTMIVGSLEKIAAVRALTMLRDFYFPKGRTHLQSGMMYLPMIKRVAVRTVFLRDAANTMSQVRGDGEFLDSLFRGQAATWQGVFGDELVVSYKLHVRQKKGQPIPPGAGVVCFHGHPRPWATPLWSRV